MGEYLSPGVYVEEVPSGAKPIEGVGTSTGAFVGITRKGPVGKAVLVTNWTQFVNTFGGFIADGYLAYSVYQFFNEGGTRCYVARALDDTATSASVQDNLMDRATPAVATLSVEAVDQGDWGNDITVEISDASKDPDKLFKLTVKYYNTVEVFDLLSMEELTGAGNPNPDHVETRINEISKLIKVEDLDSLTPAHGDRPATGSFNLTGGLQNLQDADFVGTEANKKGLHAFDSVDNINIVAIPDKPGDREVIISGFTYCQNRGDCFFVADPPFGLKPQGVLAFKEGDASYGIGEFAGNAFNSSFGALYYPWIKVMDPLTGTNKLTPPSGAIAGTYSFTDVSRGVHKAPAGITEGYLNSAMAIETIVTKGEHDTLNPEGINVIRSFPGAGICVWGARTLSADSEWKYINVRRLLLFIEESIDGGTQWVVFEPNDPSLWGSVKRNLTAFLLRVWRDGALFGLTPDEAFFVKVDAENNPPEVRDAGQLIIEIGVAPVKPAEFVIIRISQKTLTK